MAEGVYVQSHRGQCILFSIMTSRSQTLQCCLRVKDDRKQNALAPFGLTGSVCSVFRMNCFAGFVAFGLVFDFVTHRGRMFIEENSGSEPLYLFTNYSFSICIYMYACLLL
jgi:hypothetical protein